MLTRTLETIHIAFGVDAPYIPHLAAAILSIVQGAASAHFHFIIMHGGVSAERRAQLELCAPAAAFDWVKVDDSVLCGLEGHSHISRATFYRLILPRVAGPDIKRLLYLDSDVIVARDIRGLWRADMNGHAICAVQDIGIDASDFASAWRLEASATGYFNAGVLLIDLEHARAAAGFDAALAFILADRPRLAYLDQDALNHAFWGQWQPLDPIWNVQRNMILREKTDPLPASMRGFGKPAIVHYTGDQKPWQSASYHPYAWLYWHALARTPFWTEVATAAGLTRPVQLRMALRFLKRWPFFAPLATRAALNPPPGRAAGHRRIAHRPSRSGTANCAARERRPV